MPMRLDVPPDLRKRRDDDLPEVPEAVVLAGAGGEGGVTGDGPMPEIDETETGYLVSIPSSEGWVRFNFESVEQHRSHSIDADLTVWQDIPGVNTSPFTGRLNILSLSQRANYRRQLDDAFGAGGWTPMLNRACQLVKHAWTEKDWSVDLSKVRADTETRYAIRPLIPEGLPSMLIGAGDIGKTYVAQRLAKGAIDDQPLLDDAGPGGSVLMVDYESTGRDTKKRLLKLGLDSFERFIYWPGRGRPLPEMVPALARVCAERDVRLLVVDSAALACGGDPKDEQVATRYFNALATLGVSSLTISHLTKDEKDDRHPFGSIYWFNSARMVWNLKGGDPESNPRHLGLFCRKSNEDARPRPIGIRMTFGDGTVEIEQEPLVSEFTEYLSLPKRLRARLITGAKSVKELAELEGAKPGSLKKALSRMAEVTSLGLSDDGSGLWGLRADE